MDLATRFAAVHTCQELVEKKSALYKLSFAELQDLTIKFGEKKIGQPYHQVVHDDPKYCQWFLRKYGQSEKPEHQEFIYFLNQWTERMEMNVGNVEIKVKGTTSAASAKAKAMAGPPEISSSEETDPEMEFVEKVKPKSSTRAELDATHERMDRMEEMMNQMMQHVQQLTVSVQAPKTPNQ